MPEKKTNRVIASIEEAAKAVETYTKELEKANKLLEAKRRECAACFRKSGKLMIPLKPKEVIKALCEEFESLEQSRNLIAEKLKAAKNILARL